MGKINVLGFEVANLIAAGEVVERPASVVKELLENAIDAGATHITTEIKRGGVSLIAVTDNGCGMTAEDLPLAIRRHATSKITSADDLDAIATLGFRGEALAAIAAVSELTILTKTKSAEMGTMLVSSGGVVTDLSEVGTADGTTVVVEKLFADVPARLKFLKKDRTEAMAVGSLLEKIALSRPDIAFRFVSDGETKFVTAGDGNVLSVLHALYGKAFASSMLAVSHEHGGVKVEGYIGAPENNRGTRAHQSAFINGRYVRSKTIMAALEEAYTSYMAPQRYPVCCLYLTIDYSRVDVNVHPAKMEVRFSDERPIFEAIYWATRNALEQNVRRPALTLSSERTQKGERLLGAFTPIGGAPKAEQLSIPTPATHSPSPSFSYQPKAPTASPKASLEGLSNMEDILAQSGILSVASGSQARFSSTTPEPPVFSIPYSESKPKDMPSSHQVECQPASESSLSQNHPAPVTQAASSMVSSQERDTASTPESTWRLLGVLFDFYIVAETPEGLLLVDQHAAHERLLFEELLAEQKQHGSLASQGLLLPLAFNMSREAVQKAEECKEEFALLGYDYHIEDEKNVTLLAIPLSLDMEEAQSFFEKATQEMADSGITPSILDEKRREKTLYQMACKAAIKGGRHYDTPHLVWLLHRLKSLPDITVCPHGRPIAYTISKHELDRYFGRI